MGTVDSACPANTQTAAAFLSTSTYIAGKALASQLEEVQELTYPSAQ